jgi:hypothetical protein
MEQKRMVRPPVDEQDRGPWVAANRKRDIVVLQSEDFHHDVALILSGDFKDFASKMRYAEWLSSLLTKACSSQRSPDTSSAVKPVLVANELKTCPFCGGEATLKPVSDATWVGCDNPLCDVLPWFYGRSEFDASARWNQRGAAAAGSEVSTPQRSDTALLDGLEALVSQGECPGIINDLDFSQTGRPVHITMSEAMRVLLRELELLLCAPTETSVKMAHEKVLQALRHSRSDAGANP